MGYVSQNRLFVSQNISVYQNQLGTEQLAYIFYDIHYTLVYSFNQSLLIFFLSYSLPFSICAVYRQFDQFVSMVGIVV